MKVFIALVLCGLAVHTFAASCGKQSDKFYSDVANFLDCIGDEIQDELDDKATSQSEINKIKSNIRGYFDAEQSCPAPNLNQDLEVMVSQQSFIPQAVKNLVGRLRELFFLIARDEGLSQCLLNRLRQEFLEFLKDCLDANIPTGENKYELDDMPVLRDNDVASVKLFQDYVETHLKAYIGMHECSTSSRNRIIKKITKKSRASVCECVQDKFVDSCRQTYRSLCPKTASCLRSLVSKPSQAFKGAELKEAAIYCFDHESTSNAVSRTRLADLGLDVYNAISKIKNSGSSTQNKQFGEFIQNIIKSHFSTDFCTNDCNV